MFLGSVTYGHKLTFQDKELLSLPLLPNYLGDQVLLAVKIFKTQSPMVIDLVSTWSPSIVKLYGRPSLARSQNIHETQSPMVIDLVSTWSPSIAKLFGRPSLARSQNIEETKSSLVRDLV